MARIRQRDTAPEMAVRRLAYSLGYRFRLHRRDLPGRPDIVFAGRRKALFVHGCFWHSHPGCKWATIPKTRTDYWDAKLAANRDRDRKVEAQLRELGWDVAVVWECETRSAETLAARLRLYLDGGAEADDHSESLKMKEPG